MWRGEGGSGGSGEKREERRGRVALGGTVETTLSWFAQEPFSLSGYAHFNASSGSVTQLGLSKTHPLLGSTSDCLEF